MARITRIERPPATGNRSLDDWLQRLTDALNALPYLSIVSGSPSGLTAGRGSLAVNVSSTGSVLWLNVSGTTSGWSSVDYR